VRGVELAPVEGGDDLLGEALELVEHLLGRTERAADELGAAPPSTYCSILRAMTSGGPKAVLRARVASSTRFLGM